MLFYSEWKLEIGNWIKIFVYILVCFLVLKLRKYISSYRVGLRES